MHKFGATDDLVTAIGAALKRAEAEGNDFAVYLLRMALLELGAREATALGQNLQATKPPAH